MFNQWEHARQIGTALASSLATLECRCLSPDGSPRVARETGRVTCAIAEAWHAVVDDTKAGGFELSASYLSHVHGLLASAAGADAPGQFRDRGELSGTCWSATVSELLAASDGFDFSYLTDAVILAALRWEGHVRSMALTLGWFCLNGVHLQERVWAIYPPPADHDRLVEYLHFAGPDCRDPESLRALLGGYTDNQRPV